jgi:hypothetical protein
MDRRTELLEYITGYLERAGVRELEIVYHLLAAMMR